MQGVKVDILFHPRGLVELDDSVDFLQLQSKPQVELEVPVMDNVLGFIHQVGISFRMELPMSNLSLSRFE